LKPQHLFQFSPVPSPLGEIQNQRAQKWL